MMRSKIQNQGVLGVVHVCSGEGVSKFHWSKSLADLTSGRKGLPQIVRYVSVAIHTSRQITIRVKTDDQKL